MYFINDEHLENYELLMSLYNERYQDNAEFKSSSYIAALPEIFKCIDIDNVGKSTTALAQLIEYDYDLERDVASHPALTGGTTRLTEFGMSCYNSSRVSIGYLVSSLSEEYFDVLIQAMKIRAKQ